MSGVIRRVGNLSQNVDASGNQAVYVVNPVVDVSATIVNSLLKVDISGVTPVGGALPVTGTVTTTASYRQAVGTHGNMDNASAVTGASVSSVIDISTAECVMIFGKTTDATNSIILQLSADNTNWYEYQARIYPNFSDTSSPYDFQITLQCVAANYVRLSYATYTSATVTATCMYR
jgi:hypothetical protein